MCGIFGVSSITEQSYLKVLEGLLSLQHRGQDSFGIANENFIYKKTGLIKDIDQSKLQHINGKYLVGHVRYRTSGNLDISQIQPLTTGRVTVVHNGNIINKEWFGVKDYSEFSDSQLLCMYLSKRFNKFLTNEFIYEELFELQKNLVGSFSVLIIIKNFGLVALRDKNGIRPLLMSEVVNDTVCFSSESNALGINNYKDLQAGEVVICRKFNNQFTISTRVYEDSALSPCLFEYIYFANNDSVLDKILVYQARYKMGELLADNINKNDFDFIVPVPESGRIFAYAIANKLGLPIHEAIVKNRYVDRTFIMTDKNTIKKNIKKKLSLIGQILKNKRILLVDDSIVRGNTSKHIVKALRKIGAQSICLLSAAPKIVNVNNYGIFLPNKEELVAFQRRDGELEREIGCDKIIFNDLNETIDCLRQLNPTILNFETSMFIP